MLIAFLMVVSIISGCGRYSQPSNEEDNTKSDKGNNGKNSQNVKATEKPDQSQDPEENAPGSAVALKPVGVADGLDHLYGYADQNDQIVIDPKFIYAEPFHSNGTALVRDANGNYGVIDLTGNYIVQPEYSYVSFNEGLYCTHDDRLNKSIAYDDKGNVKFSLDGYMLDFSDGLAILYKGDGNCYIDTNGQVAFETDCKSLGDFIDGIARVSQEYSGPAYYIDKSGNDLTQSISSGLKVFQDPSTELFGYQDQNGVTVIDPVFVEAEPFFYGYAIVNATSDSWIPQYGIIDIKGRYVFEPKYIGIERMRNGAFSVGIESEPESDIPQEYIHYSPKALLSKDLQTITDWEFEGVVNYDRDTLCVTNGESTYFVDANLDEVSSLPELDGRGTFSREGDDYLSGYLNGRFTVSDMKGNIVMEDEGLVRLGDDLYATTEIEAPDNHTTLKYPVINGISDSAVEDGINQILKEELADDYLTAGDGDEEYYFEVLDTSFTLTRKKNLINADLLIDSYYIGAVHGAQYRNNIYLDITNGRQYYLDDLFKSPQEAYAKIAEIITGEMQKAEDGKYFEDHVTPEQISFFAMSNEGINIYFGEYEIAPYAAGMPSFLIPFDDIKEYIDTEGDFWQSFN